MLHLKLFKHKRKHICFALCILHFWQATTPKFTTVKRETSQKLPCARSNSLFHKQILVTILCSLRLVPWTITQTRARYEVAVLLVLPNKYQLGHCDSFTNQHYSDCYINVKFKQVLKTSVENYFHCKT